MSASILACVLCIAAVVVPIALLFGLPKERTTTAVTDAVTTPSPTTVTTTETPIHAIDGLLTTKYVNNGLNGFPGNFRPQSGINTGFYVTPTISNRSIARALRFATGNDDPRRDPLIVTLEGTNATAAGALDLGSSWNLIYNGSTGIDPIIVPSRSTYVAQQNFSNNIAYSSYRLLVTLQRNYTDCVQYSEAQILGYI